MFARVEKGIRMQSQNSTRFVLLTALIWAASLFGISFGFWLGFHLLNQLTGSRLDPSFGGYFHAMLTGPALGGVIAGYATARLFKRYAQIPSLRAISVAFVFGAAALLAAILPFYLTPLIIPPADPQPLNAIPEAEPSMLGQILRLSLASFLSWLVPGLFAGLHFAREIWRGGLKINGTAKMAAGWGLGFALGGGISVIVMDLFFISDWFRYIDAAGPLMALLNWLNFGVAGLIAGAIGAWATVRITSPAVRKAGEAVSSSQLSRS